QTLAALGLDDAERDRILTVHNKIDLLGEAERAALAGAASRREDEVAISAVAGDGLDELLGVIEARLGADNVVRRIKLDVEAGDALAWLYRHCAVIDRKDRDRGVEVKAAAPEATFQRFDRLFGI
ncbi:MAG: GTPase HflX, partial [Pseudomonadota bacterium]